MAKKPSHRKRQQAKRRARAHRARRRQPSRPEVTPAAAASDRTDAARREQALAELQEALLTAIRNGEFVVDDEDEDDEFDDWEFEDEDDLGHPPIDFEPVAQQILVEAVAEILSNRTAAPAIEIAQRLREQERYAEYDLCPGDSVMVGEMVALGILLDVRYGPARPDTRAAVRWVGDHLGAEHARRALGVADLLGHPDSPPWSTVRPGPSDDANLLPALVLLLAGAAATTPGA
ncbi:hypothetical protein [Cryptosporangium aurantiacum]|uniref:Uncharacterized protein n=1 Tax=Cryptosporangium aurantiacum TaxID=134849 RepID=A0A1M7RMY6_9ACTN|nr:hypothetical protein [Cryptosporangium aurantiacum]SHN47579.1 hypothetical protein SAMN05443668_12539 [Cryptosporangium aurantiacum]